MSVRSGHLLAAIVGIERAVVHHALAAVCLNRMALQVSSWPLGRLQGRLDLWRSPVHQSLACGGLDDHNMPGIIRPGHLPRSARDPRAIRTGGHCSGRKAVEAIMLVIVKHGQQAQALGVAGTGSGYRMDSAVDDKEYSPCGQRTL